MPDKLHENNPEVRHYTPPREDAPNDRQENGKHEYEVRINASSDV